MRVIGLMSGMSYDGIDVAVADWRRDGDTLWPAGLVVLARAARGAAVGHRGDRSGRTGILDAGPPTRHVRPAR